MLYLSLCSCKVATISAWPALGWVFGGPAVGPSGQDMVPCPEERLRLSSSSESGAEKRSEPG